MELRHVRRRGGLKKKIIKTLMNEAETKFFDVTTIDGLDEGVGKVGGGNTRILTSSIVEDDTAGGRDGHDIHVTKINIRCMMGIPRSWWYDATHTSTDELYSQGWRWVLAEFPDETGTTLAALTTLTKYYTNVTTEGVGAMGFLTAPANPDDAKINILAGGFISLRELMQGAPADPSLIPDSTIIDNVQTPPGYFFNIYKKFKTPKKVSYNGTTGASCTNPIALVVWANHSCGGASEVQLHTLSRIMWKDI